MGRGHRAEATSRWRAALALLVVPAMVVTAPVELVASRPGAVPAERAESAPTAHPWAVRSWARTGHLLATDASAAGGQRSVSAKGTRLWSASELASHDLPTAARRAYRRAAERMARTDPGCRLPWTLLAGVGRVESDHGRYGGSRLGSDGVSRPLIFGLRLDGTGPLAAIRDTDRGRLDRDRVWDRAVGPMQFIPATWASAARDGDGDGTRSPHDLDDAAAAAAGYLCTGSGNLQDPATQAAAIYRYNQDDYYVALVQAFEVGYRTGVFVIPPPPVEQDPGRRPVRARALRPVHRSAGAQASADSGGEERPAASKSGDGGAPAPEPSPKPSPESSPEPDPKPTPTPAPEPVPTEVVALLTECEGGYCLGGKVLDLGILAPPDAQAPGDLDLDGAVETNGAEIAGMLGSKVTMVVVPLDSGKLGILSVNGVSLG